MTTSIIMFCMLLNTNPVPSPDPVMKAASLSSREYQIYSLLIDHLVTDSCRGKNPAWCSIVMDDSTIDIPNGDFATLSDSALNLVYASLMEVLLYSFPDTIQVDLLMRDHAAQNRSRCALSIDSMRLQLARYSFQPDRMADVRNSAVRLLREAPEDIPDTCNYHGFTFSRCGFNMTGDQALVRVFYNKKNRMAHMITSSTHEVFLIRKGVDWQLVQDRVLSNGFGSQK
jgi:hypothetical protein